MTYAVLSLVLIIIALILLYLNNHYSYWTRRDVPQEDPNNVFGNLKGVGRTVHLIDINQRLYRRFKHSSAFAGMYFFFARAAMIIDLDLIKQILIKDFASFQDRGLYNNTRDDPLTGHLLTLKGAQWRALRNKLTPVFTSGKMKFMFPTLVQVARNLSQTCGELLQAHANAVVDCKELSARYTTDVIGTCVFGIECNSLQNPEAEFRRKGRLIFSQPRHTQAVQLFMQTSPDLALKLRMKFFPDEVSEFFIDAVRRTVAYRQQHNVKRNDFMDLLIELMAKDQQAAAQSDGIDLTQGLTLLQMAAQAFVFFVAGFHTSSTTMAFCLYELALHQDVQHRLREEIMSVLQAHNNELCYAAVQEMQYLDQVLAETLRKYPVLPFLLRKAVADYHVPHTKHIIEKGTVTVIPVYAIHHDPELYAEPEKFDPTRFEPVAIKQRHPCAYLPFGEGPRNCIGLRFGKMQTKVGLISLLQNFKFSKSARTEVPVPMSKKVFILTAENGIYLHVERV